MLTPPLHLLAFSSLLLLFVPPAQVKPSNLETKPK
jgi:hypothetical protein